MCCLVLRFCCFDVFCGSQLQIIETFSKMPKVEVEPNVELYYEIHGSGQHKVVFIMGQNSLSLLNSLSLCLLEASSHRWERHETGLNGTHRVWLPNVERMMEETSDFQFLIFDNRGVGKSSVPPGRYTLILLLDLPLLGFDLSDGLQTTEQSRWPQTPSNSSIRSDGRMIFMLSACRWEE